MTREKLSEVSKDDLIEIILLLVSEIKQLRKENEKLKVENEDLKGKLGLPRKDSENSSIPPALDKKPKIEKAECRKMGPPVGHTGVKRENKREPDVVIFEKIKRCKGCGSEIESNSERYESHIIYEMPPIKLVVIEIRRQRDSCNICGREIIADNPVGIRENQVFGLNFEIFLTMMKERYNVSYEKVKELVKDLCNENISDGLIDNIRERVSNGLKGEYEGIKEDIRKSEVVGCDETGWRVEGKNGWMWIFQNKNASYYKIDEHRSSEVVKEVLGEKYDGTIVSDFFSAYGLIESKKKQKCLAHLLRDINYGEEVEEGSETFSKEIKEVIKSAIELSKERENIIEETYKEKAIDIEKRFSNCLEKEVTLKVNERLKKRLIKHREEIFPFLYDSKIPFDNNASEQDIRKIVIKRKVSNGSRSMEGAKRTAIIYSVIETIRKRGGDVLEELRKLLGVKSNIAVLQPT